MPGGGALNAIYAQNLPIFTRPQLKQEFSVFTRPQLKQAFSLGLDLSRDFQSSLGLN